MIGPIALPFNAMMAAMEKIMLLYSAQTRVSPTPARGPIKPTFKPSVVSYEAPASSNAI